VREAGWLTLGQGERPGLRRGSGRRGGAGLAGRLGGVVEAHQWDARCVIKRPLWPRLDGRSAAVHSLVQSAATGWADKALESHTGHRAVGPPPEHKDAGWRGAGASFGWHGVHQEAPRGLASPGCCGCPGCEKTVASLTALLCGPRLDGPPRRPAAPAQRHRLAWCSPRGSKVIGFGRLLWLSRT
jgi:hypothetical protein